MTKLCTCRSGVERPGSVSVCTEFVFDSPPPAARCCSERPRHECDERLTSEEQTDQFRMTRGHFLSAALTA